MTMTANKPPRGVYLRGNVYWVTWRDLQGKRYPEPAGPVLRITPLVNSAPNRRLSRRKRETKDA
jgi:hypothetical protein